MFWNETRLEAEELNLIDTLQVTLVEVFDVEEVRYDISWSMVTFERDFIKIQLHVPEPDSVSMFGEVASLEVSLWAASVFQSEKGKAVRRGTTLHWQVYRLASESVQEEI